MTTKDWILLLLPIILNSFIFYFIQKRFDNKMRKKNEFEDRKRNYERILYQSCNKLIRLMDSLDKEARKSVREFDIQKFNDILSLFSEELKKATETIENNIEMEEYIEDTNKFIDKFNVICGMTRHHIQKYHSSGGITNCGEYIKEEMEFKKTVQIRIELVILRIDKIKNKIRENIKN